MQQLMFGDPRVSGQRQAEAPKGSVTSYVFEKPVGSHFGGDFGLSVECPKCHRAGCEVESAKGVKSWVHVFSIQLNRKGNPVVRKGLACTE